MTNISLSEAYGLIPQMDLVQKSFLYIQAAVEDVEAGAPKAAYRHLIAAVTCLLKARLAKEHWVLLFQRPIEADPAKFESGDFTAVDFGEIKERLEVICKLDLSKYAPLLTMCRERPQNAFEVSCEEPEIRSLLSTTWSFMQDFLRIHLPDESKEQQAETIRNSMIENENFLDRRYSEIKLEIVAMRRQEIPVVSCPLCLQEKTFVLPKKDYPHCFFCGYQGTPKATAREFISVFVQTNASQELHSINQILNECSACSAETSVRFKWDSWRPPYSICFSCGTMVLPTVVCPSCKSRFVQQGQDESCPTCVSDLDLLEAAALESITDDRNRNKEEEDDE